VASAEGLDAFTITQKFPISGRCAQFTVVFQLHQGKSCCNCFLAAFLGYFFPQKKVTEAQ
jgi:hypothetical protein